MDTTIKNLDEAAYREIKERAVVASGLTLLVTASVWNFLLVRAHSASVTGLRRAYSSAARSAR